MSTASPTASEWHNTPSAFDFRSDTVTTPSARQLSSLTTASLGDDVYQESTTTTRLTHRIARMLNKPSALFVPSGTMGNQISLSTLLSAAGGPPHSILCDSRSHVYLHEAGACATISGAQLTPITPSNGTYLTLHDIQSSAILTDDAHFAPTRVISLENTVSGAIQPLSETRRISAWARANGILVHLDGARLWNAAKSDPDTLRAFAECADSLSVCLSKSIGAPIGSFVAASDALIARATRIRKMLGGSMRQAGVVTAMAEVALDEVWEGGELRRVDEVAKRVEAAWGRLGGQVAVPVDTNQVWLDLGKRGVPVEVWQEVAEEMGVKVGGERIVVHWQNSREGVEALERVMVEACRRADAGVEGREGDRAVGRYLNQLKN